MSGAWLAACITDHLQSKLALICFYAAPLRNPPTMHTHHPQQPPTSCQQPEQLTALSGSWPSVISRCGLGHPVWKLPSACTQLSEECLYCCQTNNWAHYAMSLSMTHTQDTHTELTEAPFPRPYSAPVSLEVKLIISKVWCEAPFSGDEELTVSVAAYKHLCFLMSN